MASSSSLLCILSLFSVFYLISSTPGIKFTTISISMNQFTKNSPLDPWQKLTHLAFASLARAKHLKNPHLSTAPLFPQSYGAYSIPLSFGTPPQTIPFILDTGSHLVWFPCTHRYLCKNCSFSNPDKKVTYFIPKSSSSSKIIGCKNPKCTWIHDQNVQSRCKDCEPNSANCTQICPPYFIIYGSASTSGILLSETLDFSDKKVPDFVVGCSLLSSHSPTGIAGFGRGPASLPSQLRLNKFSYCLLSHRFDDTSKNSSLILYGGSDSSDTKTVGVSYTPILKNPSAGNPALSVYYYVDLRKIIIGGKQVKIPYNYLSQGSDGDGGTIVDSGSTFTFMEGRIFELVARELENQTSRYRRATYIEKRTGLRPCFDISADKSVSLPELALHFKGGAKIKLPLANYFSFIDDSGVVCLTIVTNGVDSSSSSSSVTDVFGGPSVILGNFQLQNFYVEFDLENERLGFRRQICK